MQSIIALGFISLTRLRPSCGRPLDRRDSCVDRNIADYFQFIRAKKEGCRLIFEIKPG